MPVCKALNEVAEPVNAVPPFTSMVWGDVRPTTKVLFAVLILDTVPEYVTVWPDAGVAVGTLVGGTRAVVAVG